MSNFTWTLIFDCDKPESVAVLSVSFLILSCTPCNTLPIAYIPAGTKETVTKTEIQKYNKKKWISFDQFKDVQFGIWKLTLPNNSSEWTKGICNCPNFFKEYICKYVVGMGIRLKFCKPPPAAKNTFRRKKKKRATWKNN